VFDEVVTGFRLKLGGAQQEFGVVPDLCALAKAMGGGLPLAAVAGKRELIELTVPGVSPKDRPVYMGNTLNGNPLACAAGLATLEVLEEEDGPARITAMGSLLHQGFHEIASRLDVPLHVIGPPAFGDPAIGDGNVYDLASYNAQNRKASTAFGVELLRRGIFVNPGFKMYVSTAHTPAHVDLTVETAFEALKAVKEAGLIEA
jgi:glutamate-1-semialdehyde 2,1-aminomutase